MMKYVNLILLSDSWENYHRKEFLKAAESELSQWSDVVFIELPLSLLVHPITNFRKFVKITKNIIFPRKESGKYKLLTPIILFHFLLWHKFDIFFEIDYKLFNYQIKRFLRKKNANGNIILWVFFPYLLKLAHKCKQSKSILIYDQYDLHNININGIENIKITKMNNELIKMCDIVFCTTEYIYNISKTLNENSYYITNGNNFNILNNKNIKSEAVKNKSKKIVGYIGGIRNWIDFELLNYVIFNLQEVEFVFIGRVYKESYDSLKKLCKNKNVIWNDFVPHNKLIEHLEKFDAGIIPFKKNRFFNGVFPNKFFEYLAVGIPVITSPLPELIKYKEIICVSDGKESFLDGIKSVLNGDYSIYKSTYIKMAEQNSWEKKASNWNQIMEQFIFGDK